MTDIVTLKAICDELKIDPRDARERLRAAASDAKTNPELSKARKPRTPWQWVKGSAAEKEARRALLETKTLKRGGASVCR
ncbi:MAG: hypothetical protein GVY36_17580 [Verrucomicrobia bacterium]|jgi:hypothetical protein|nr:hypothetical protein [Verrucomicrobiota bacterium]